MCHLWAAAVRQFGQNQVQSLYRRKFDVEDVLKNTPEVRIHILSQNSVMHNKSVQLFSKDAQKCMVGQPTDVS